MFDILLGIYGRPSIDYATVFDKHFYAIEIVHIGFVSEVIWYDQRDLKAA